VDVAERDISMEDVEREHRAEVDPRLHWVYILVVILGGTVAMLGLMGLLGA
jgi:hypothetical protein